MAFTAYIFKSDAEKLKSGAIHGVTGGYLFGQWTSTGNPVVHVVKRSEARDVGQRLYDAYRICHIGAWRVVSRDDSLERKRIAFDLGRQQSRQRGRDAAMRILILDVSGSRISPYLYTSLTQRELKEQVGTPDLLEGDNPFDNISPRNPQFPAVTNQPSHYSAAALQQRQYPGHAISQTQEAEIQSHQWYSNESGGSELLKYVLDALKKIAEGGKVDISRDTVSHDMSLMFQRFGTKWEVKFPGYFPKLGAMLIETRQSPIGNDTPREWRQPNFDDVREAIERMVRQITGSRY